jgi:hypothetical protein
LAEQLVTSFVRYARVGKERRKKVQE